MKEESKEQHQSLDGKDLFNPFSTGFGVSLIHALLLLIWLVKFSPWKMMTDGRFVQSSVKHRFHTVSKAGSLDVFFFGIFFQVMRTEHRQQTWFCIHVSFPEPTSSHQRSTWIKSKWPLVNQRLAQGHIKRGQEKLGSEPPTLRL